MRRRSFLAALPFSAAGTAAAAQQRTESRRPNTDDTAAPSRTPDAPAQLETRAGDRISGTKWQSRSAVWGVNGAAATAHPTATMLAIETLRRGGSAIDAAITANAALGFLEPTGNGIGGDAFVMLWDPQQRKVVSPERLRPLAAQPTLEDLQRRAKNGKIPFLRRRPVSVPAPSTPGGPCTSATAACRGRT
jgi:gamma-glutamyltranspeptidase/glutathione hydrolase